jgi:hypothetical protein
MYFQSASRRCDPRRPIQAPESTGRSNCCLLARENRIDREIVALRESHRTSIARNHPATFRVGFAVDHWGIDRKRTCPPRSKSGRSELLRRVERGHYRPDKRRRALLVRASRRAVQSAARSLYRKGYEANGFVVGKTLYNSEDDARGGRDSVALRETASKIDLEDH